MSLLKSNLPRLLAVWCGSVWSKIETWVVSCCQSIKVSWHCRSHFPKVLLAYKQRPPKTYTSPAIARATWKRYRTVMCNSSLCYRKYRMPPIISRSIYIKDQSLKINCIAPCVVSESEIYRVSLLNDRQTLTKSTYWALYFTFFCNFFYIRNGSQLSVMLSMYFSWALPAIEIKWSEV